jgi:nudix-type nucleoside diphosphatase (YffH/AdpP family)
MIVAGALADPKLWRLAAPSGQGEAVLVPGHVLAPARQGPWAVAVAGEGQVEALRIAAPEGELTALAYLARALGQGPGPAGLWLGMAGEGEIRALPPVLVALAEDCLLWQGEVAPEALARRMGPMLVRAASRLRVDPGATQIRRSQRPEDVVLVARRLPYRGFFAMEEYDLSWRRFDGEMSATTERACFLSGDAVTVLPYDARRDRVLVVEQFRAGPLARGDGACWQIEAIAGRVDPFETPEEAARREAVEEAGLQLSELEFVSRYYPSPGAVSEYIYSYVAMTDLPDDAAGVFGVAEEVEDIRGHLLSFETLMALIASGEIDNAPLQLTALWLQRERLRLRSL